MLNRIVKGIKLGIKARELFSELRINDVDPWETENPYSRYYKKSSELRKDVDNINYIGLAIGQLIHPIEWYKNAGYLFNTKKVYLINLNWVSFK